MIHRIAQRCLAVSALLASGSAAATDLPRVFVTSVSGTGNLSSWADAHGNTGLQAADEICRTRAAAGSIASSSEYIAWISVSNSDAYCRVHGLAGTRNNGNLCNGAGLPGTAGPWYRMDDEPAIDVAANSMVAYPQAGYVPRHILFDEFRNEVPALPFAASLAYTSTQTDGSFNAAEDCEGWTSANSMLDVTGGGAYRGALGWTDGFLSTCSGNQRLICLKKGSHGVALARKRPPSARMAFTTSVAGPGNLSLWAGANGMTGIDAGDSICRTLAAQAHLPLASTYKAWLSTSGIDVTYRFVFSGPWYRTDGVRVAGYLADWTDGVLGAPLQLDEFAQPLGFSGAWTGTLQNGQRSGFSCSDWTSGSEFVIGSNGSPDSADSLWTQFPGSDGESCDATMHLYCLADNDSLFLDGFDP